MVRVMKHVVEEPVMVTTMVTKTTVVLEMDMATANVLMGLVGSIGGSAADFPKRKVCDEIYTKMDDAGCESTASVHQWAWDGVKRIYTTSPVPCTLV